jgi:RNA ligase (TIGR02306 family)
VKKFKKNKLNMDATIEIIQNIKPHPNADRLELGTILGYQVIIPKGIYKDGQKIMFVHPDAQLPKDQDWATEYLQYAPKRVKAIRLREEWSEGLVIPLEKLPIDFSDAEEGLDVSDVLGITHYSAPQPQELNAIGGLPLGIPKTDEKRFEELRQLPLGEICDVTLKIDGKSTSIAYDLFGDQVYILGRTLAYEVGSNNHYGRVFSPEFIGRFVQYCKDKGISLCLRGEAFGEGIQNKGNNPHSKLPLNFALYNVYNIRGRKYEMKGSPLYFEQVAKELDILHVPILEKDVPITEELIKKYSVGLKEIFGKAFEGVVVKYSTGSFKIINKWYDAKNE